MRRVSPAVGAARSAARRDRVRRRHRRCRSARFFAWGPITVEGRTPPPGENFINADQRIVGGRYFRGDGDPAARAGASSTSRTRPTSPRVVVVDEFMARELWPNAGPDRQAHSLRRLEVDRAVADRRRRGRPREAVHARRRRRASRCICRRRSRRRARCTWRVRSRGDPAALAAAVKQEIRALDPDLPLYHVRTMARAGRTSRWRGGASRCCC